jgi:RND superfamily putative drug exporter
MASYLNRLGRFAFRRRRLVVLVWLVILAAAITGAATLSGPTSNAFRIPGTPSQKAIDLLGQRFPQASAGGATARVVFAAPAGHTITEAAYRAAIESAVTGLHAGPQVTSVSDPFQTRTINRTATVAIAQVSYRVQANQLTDAARSALTATTSRARTGGLRVEVGGDAVRPPTQTGLAEMMGVAVAAIVLVITFGSLVAAGLPLLTAVLGIGIALGTITALTGSISLSSNTPILALMLGLAVAIDYALFIVSRYRHELATGRDGEEAAGHAVATAGSAVVFAGLTVLIALAALSVVNIPIITQMGLAAAGTVALAVVIALTLLPALLGFTGSKILAGRIPGLQARDPEQENPGQAGPAQTDGLQTDGPQTDGPQTDDTQTLPRPTLGLRWVLSVARRPITVLVVAVAALGVVAIPALDLQLAMPDDSTAGPDTTQRKAYDLISSGFGPGFNGPLTVVVEAPAGSAATLATTVAGAITTLPDVTAVIPTLTNPAADTTLLTVIPASGPSTTRTADLVRAIRHTNGTIPGASIQVTGLTAINIDISDRLGSALLPYLGIVVGLAFLLLMLVFRSILVPITAALGFLLSIAATLGAVVAVFEWGWLARLVGIDQAGPLISFLPIMVIGIVFGLAMDYQVFLVTRMREEHAHGAPAREAVVTGFSHGARVVTAAAIIMISVFAGFVFSAESFVKAIGFALAVAVLFDAVIVRMTIVPAVMTLIRGAAWWLPSWVDRLLPDIDVEGQKLLPQPEAPQPAAPQPQPGAAQAPDAEDASLRA